MSTRRPKVPRAGKAPAPATRTRPGKPAHSRPVDPQHPKQPGPRQPGPKQPGSRRPGPKRPDPKQPGPRRFGDPVIGRVEDTATPVPAKAFSGRLLALAVVLVTIIVLLAPSIHTFMKQRADIAELQTQIAQAKDTKAELTREISRWEDPAFVKQQARKRFFMVMPGETSYLVIGAKEQRQQDREQAAISPQRDLPWADALWVSVTRAATD